MVSPHTARAVSPFLVVPVERLLVTPQRLDMLDAVARECVGQGAVTSEPRHRPGPIGLLRRRPVNRRVPAFTMLVMSGDPQAVGSMNTGSLPWPIVAAGNPPDSGARAVSSGSS